MATSANCENQTEEDKKKLLIQELCSSVDNKINLYLANQEVTFIDEKQLLRKVKIGQENATQNQQHKVIMLLGETGAGKSTLINAMFNYLVGVDFHDNFRLNLIDQEKSEYGELQNPTKSQTTYITSYTIHYREGFTIPFTLTIIDTPGFGDTDGIQRDEEITEQIGTFFKKKGSNGIDAIDAVGFVTQSFKPRLTPTQRYIFESILSLFGKDIKENIFMLLPFADIGTPLVLRALKEAEVPHQQYFKFNNTKFSSEDRKSPVMEDYWDMGKESFNAFLGGVGSCKNKKSNSL